MKTPSEGKPRRLDRQVHSWGAAPSPAASVGEAVLAQQRATTGAQGRKGASLRPGGQTSGQAPKQGADMHGEGLCSKHAKMRPEIGSTGQRLLPNQQPPGCL